MMFLWISEVPAAIVDEKELKYIFWTAPSKGDRSDSCD